MTVTVLYPQTDNTLNKLRYKSTTPPSRQTASHAESVGTEHTCDCIQFSQTAKEVQQAGQLSQAATDIREDKIAEIKQQIADGTYAIDTEKIASRMIADAFMLKI